MTPATRRKILRRFASGETIAQVAFEYRTGGFDVEHIIREHLVKMSKPKRKPRKRTK